MWINNAWINRDHIIFIKAVPLTDDPHVITAWKIEISMSDGTLIKPRDAFIDVESAKEAIHRILTQK